MWKLFPHAGSFQQPGVAKKEAMGAGLEPIRPKETAFQLPSKCPQITAAVSLSYGEKLLFSLQKAVVTSETHNLLSCWE